MLPYFGMYGGSMKNQPTVVMINGKEVPLWCDIFVLDEVQEEYGTIAGFERKLTGIRETEDNGKKRVYKVEPEVKTIIFALKLMMQEGYRKEAILGITREKVDPDEIIMNADIPFNRLAEILHNEFRRCFSAKK